MSVSNRLVLMALAFSLAACSGTSGSSRAVAVTPAAPAPVAKTEPAAPSTPAAPMDVAPAVAASEPTPEPVATPKPRQPYDTARAGLSVPVPRGWKTKRRDMALIYEGPMRVPSVVLFQPKAATLDEAVKGLADELRAPLGAVRITKAATAGELAGYKAYVAEGTGRAEGFPMRWRATIVDAEELTVMLALVPSFFWGANRGAVRSFENGVRRAEVRTAGLDTRETASR